MNQKDYYQILEVEKEASSQKIKEAYRRLAFQYHPDRNKGNPPAVEKMKEINEAYAVLSDPKKRRDYDAFHEQSALMDTPVQADLFRTGYFRGLTSIRFLK
jgi:curved DNA-binding protein